MPLRKLSLHKLLDLKISTPTGFVEVHAASGLLKSGDDFYVVADDQLALTRFSMEGVGQSLPLFHGELPLDYKERKKLKPDWEALVPFHNGILVIPSGSKKNRQFGSFTSPDHFQAAVPQKINFSLLYQYLEKDFPELNIEGGVVVGSTFKLFQRGNGQRGQNAVIDLDLEGVIADIEQTQNIQAHRIQRVLPYDLGFMDGVRLGFTDACLGKENRIYFLAVAESSDSTYEDGKYRGAQLGYFDPSGKVIFEYEIDCPFKPEGLWMEQKSGETIVYIVTDADSVEFISSLYTAKLSS